MSRWDDLYWFYEDKYPFKIEDLDNALYTDFFNKEIKPIYKDLKFANPYIGSDFLRKESFGAMLIGESKYINIDVKNSPEDYKIGKQFFNWALDYLINGNNSRFNNDIKGFIDKYKYSIYNQEPIISYIKVRAYELDGIKRRFRDYRGWPFPFLIRAIRNNKGCKCSNHKMELDILKEIAFVNYFPIPFVVKGKDNGFSEKVFNDLKDPSLNISWQKYCDYCNSQLDSIIESTYPKVLIFASNLSSCIYDGEYKNKMKFIKHPACWSRRKGFNDKNKLEAIIKESL